MIRQFDTQKGKNKRLLVIDREFEFQESLVQTLKRSGFAVDCTNSATQALELLGKEEFSLVLIDPKLREMSGVGLARKIRDASNVPVIFAVREESGAYRESALEVGALAVVSKRSHPDDIVIQIQLALRHADEFARSMAMNQHLARKLKRNGSQEVLICWLMEKWDCDSETARSMLNRFARSRCVSIEQLAEMEMQVRGQVRELKAAFQKQLENVRPALLSELEHFHVKKNIAAARRLNGGGKDRNERELRGAAEYTGGHEPPRIGNYPA